MGQIIDDEIADLPDKSHVFRFSDTLVLHLG